VTVGGEMPWITLERFHDRSFRGTEKEARRSRRESTESVDAKRALRMI